MRTLGALPLLALAVCDGPPLALDLNGGSCGAIAIETVDEAILPGWQIAAMVADRVDGEGAWIVAEDPARRAFLRPWPAGVGLDLSALGPADDFDLQPGLRPDESWLVLARPARARVWRLGPSARGELHEVPGLADFPGPGAWTRRLLFVGDTPHLLAVSAPQPQVVPIFKIAAIDPTTLALGPVLPLVPVQACPDELAWPCAVLEQRGEWVEILAVTAAGSMRGGAVLLATRSLDPEIAPHRDAVTLTLVVYADDAGRPPMARLLGGWFHSGTSGADVRLRGQLATDARSLFRGVSAHRPPLPPDAYLLNDLDLDQPPGASRLEAPHLIVVSALLQLGARAVIPVLADDRLALAPLDGPTIEAAIPSDIAFDRHTRVAGAGRQQLLLRPPHGPARRVRARCVPAE